MTLPKIPNDICFFIAVMELNKTNKQRADLNRANPKAGDFLDPFVEELKQIILDYHSANPNNNHNI